MLGKLDQHCQILADMPLIGMARPDMAADVRSFQVHPYTVYYRIVSDGVEVLRFIHQARDLRTLPFFSPS